ncbi:MAG: hypothetical protein II676_04500 [Bacteroidales bacterium]|nr:hypothetical protein [Bacteroidales bacterium]
MKRFSLILMMLATLALSCAREPSPGPDSSEDGFKTIHYKVQVSSFDDSKATTADNDTKYVFQATDSLYVTSTVTDPESGDPLLFGVLKLISGSGATTAYFEGDLVDVNEFEPASDTPINVTLVGSGETDRIHKTGRGKLTSTSYPSNEYGTTLADAVQKFSHFTCSTTFGATRFTLTQQSAFLWFTVSFKRTEVPVSTPITAKVFNNSEANPIWQNAVNAAALGTGRSRVDFVVAFPGGSTSLTDAELSVKWGDGENDHKEFAIDDKVLAVNNYYTVSRTTIDLGNPFHIRAKEDGTTKVTFKTTYATGTGEILYLSYDLGVDDWAPYDGSALSLSKDDVVYFKGTRTNCDCVGPTQLFTANHVCYIGGNITSLLADPTQFAENAFRSAFSNGTCVDAVTTPAEVNWVDIDSADPLILPSFTSAECYREMFRNCTSLTAMPDLPATTVAARCYWNMFRLCTGLTTACDVLPAETLAEDCYRELFRQCSSLQSAPRLPAPTLAVRSYRQMFAACTSLLSVTCLATDISATDCTYQWMSGTKNNSACTFYKASTMGVNVSGGWTRDINGILGNWNIQNYTE